MDELVTETDIKDLKKHERISALPINFMRGVDFRPREMGKSGKVIIADELQNLNYSECLTFLTRIGENCKVFLCGDPSQSDIKNSAFNKVYKMFNNEKSKENGIFVFEFSNEDIVRSELVKYIIEVFEEAKNII